MRTQRGSLPDSRPRSAFPVSVLVAGLLLLGAGAGAAGAAPASDSVAARAETPASAPVLLAQGTVRPRELQPRYEPVPPKPKGSYNSDYIFGLTKSVADSTMATPVKVLLFPLTIPLDLVFLPFAAIGGTFG